MNSGDTIQLEAPDFDPVENSLDNTWTVKRRFGKIFQKHQTIPEDIHDLHLHFNDFKNGIEKEFAFVKEATLKNVESFQSSINPQQTYSASLCSHVNNIYNKLAELQQQIQHHDLHMNSADTIQIEAPDFNPDIDDVSPTNIDQELNNPLTQGSTTPTPKIAEQVIEHITPAPSHQNPDWQETDWPDATPVEIPSQPYQQTDQRINIQWTQHNSEPVKIPQLRRKFRRKTIPGFRYLLNASQYI